MYAFDLQHQLLRFCRLVGLICAFWVLCFSNAQAQSIFDAPQPIQDGSRSVIGPFFYGSSAVVARQQGQVPLRAVQPLLRGVIIVPDVSFVGMEQAESFFDFLHEKTGSAVIAIGFNDLDKRPILQVARYSIGQAMKQETALRLLEGIAAQAKQTPAYVHASVYMPKQNAADGVVYVVIKKNGLGVRDLNQARVFDGSLAPPPEAKAVFVPPSPLPEQEEEREALVSVHIIPLPVPPPASVRLAALIPIPEAKPVLEHLLPEAPPFITIIDLPEVVKPSPPPEPQPVMAGFILVVDLSFADMADLRIFYDFLNRTQGQTLMTVGVDPQVEQRLRPVLDSYIGAPLTQSNRNHLIQEANKALSGGALLDVTDRMSADGILYLTVH